MPTIGRGLRGITSRPRWQLRTIALAIVAAVGGVDYLTGHEMLFSVFYLIAVFFAAWTLGRGFALLTSILSVAVWLVGDLASGAVYPRALVPVWNAAIILAFYVVVVWLVSRQRAMHRDLEERVRQRTAALTEMIADRERLEREVLDIGERERRRIGRDLHDSLGQLLTGTALAGQVLHEKLVSAGVPQSDDAARIVLLVEEGVELTRRLSRGLDPLELEAGGLGQGLRELAERTTALGTVRCDYDSHEPVDVRDSVTAVHLYRIAQEAVTNAIKHGHARRITVRLDAREGGVRLMVTDDGRGIGPAHAPGMGLRIMKHRAEVMRGTCEVRREPRGGTTVVCEMPNP